MKRLPFLVVLSVSVGLLWWAYGEMGAVAAPAPPSTQPVAASDGEVIQQRMDAAVELVERMSRGQFDEVVQSFDDTMKAALSAEQLAEVWKQLIDAGGAFESHGQAVTDRVDGYLRIFVPVRFERQQRVMMVIFNDDGEVAGLWVVPPRAPASQPASAPSEKDTASSKLLIRTFGATMQVWVEGGYHEVGKIISEGRQIRLAAADGRTFIQDFEEGGQIWIDPSDKTIMRASIKPGIGYFTADWFARAIDPGDSPVTQLPREKDLHAVGIRYDKESVQYTLWSDEKTGLPLRLILDAPVTEYTPDPNRTILNDIVINAPVDESLLALAPPEGYAVKEVPPIVTKRPAVSAAATTVPTDVKPARLDFRVAAVPGDAASDGPYVAQQEIGQLLSDLKAHGPDSVARKDVAWFEFPDAPSSGWYITGAYEGRSYVLLMRVKPYVMLADEDGQRAWGLMRVYADEVPRGEWGTVDAIGLEFDAIGARRFADLTRVNVHRALAILINDKVLCVPNVNQPITGGKGTFVTGGSDMDSQLQQSLIAALRLGMPPQADAVREELAPGGE